jgi:hypothetical protein
LIAVEYFERDCKSSDANFEHYYFVAIELILDLKIELLINIWVVCDAVITETWLSSLAPQSDWLHLLAVELVVL